MKPTIRPARIEDVEDLTQLHCSSLRGILSELGPTVVRRYYKRAAIDPGALLLVAEQQHAGVVGLLEVELHRRGMFSRHGFVDIVYFLANGILRPHTLLRALVLGRDGFGSPSHDAGFLRFFAISEPFRGLGIGSLMLQYAAERTLSAGMTAIETATSNTRLLAYYQTAFGGERLGARWDRPSSAVSIRITLPLPGPSGRTC